MGPEGLVLAVVALENQGQHFHIALRLVLRRGGGWEVVELEPVMMDSKRQTSHISSHQSQQGVVLVAAPVEA